MADAPKFKIKLTRVINNEKVFIELATVWEHEFAGGGTALNVSFAKKTDINGKYPSMTLEDFVALNKETDGRPGFINLYEVKARAPQSAAADDNAFSDDDF